MSDAAPPPARPSRPAHQKKNKRKRASEEQSGAPDAAPIPAPTPAPGPAFQPPAATQEPSVDGKPARKRAKKKRNATDDDDADLDLDRGLNRRFASMDSHLLAEHVARQTKRFGADLSPVELADLQLSAHAIVDTSSFDKDRALAHLPDFLAAFARGGKAHLTSAPSANGAPHTIVVTGAGLRAADLVRALRPLQSGKIMVAKLFAKHIKIAESVAFLQSRRTGIAVGTPARLIDLLENGALSVAHLQRLVIDASHIDIKKRGVLDMQDTALPVVRWLSRPEFRARYGATDDESKTPLSVLFY